MTLKTYEVIVAGLGAMGAAILYQLSTMGLLRETLKPTTSTSAATISGKIHCPEVVAGALCWSYGSQIWTRRQRLGNFGIPPQQ
jgi:hypothetical protein